MSDFKPVLEIEFDDKYIDAKKTDRMICWGIIILFYVFVEFQKYHIMGLWSKFWVLWR